MERRARTICSRLAVVLAVTVLAAPAGPCVATPADSACVQMMKGDALNSPETRAAAIVEWNKVSQFASEGQGPDGVGLALVKVDALWEIGEAQRQMEQLDTALVTLNKVLADYPQRRSKCAAAAVGIAKVYQKKEEHVKSLEWYSKVLIDYPERYVYTNFARERIDDVRKNVPELTDDLRAKLVKAYEAYDKARAEDESITAARKAAIGESEAGDVEGAKADLLQLFANPAVQKSHGHLRQLGDAQLLIGDKDNARITLEKYLAVAAEEFIPVDNRRSRIQTYYKLHDYSKVAEEAADMLSIYPDVSDAFEIHYYLAQGLDYSGQPEAALTAYGDLVSRFKTSRKVAHQAFCASSLARQGVILQRLGRKDEAIAKFQEVVSDYSGTFEASECASKLESLQAQGASQQ